MKYNFERKIALSYIESYLKKKFCTQKQNFKNTIQKKIFILEDIF